MKLAAHRSLGVAVERMRHNQAVEGARSRAQSSGNHIVNDIRNADGVEASGAVHEFLHESEAKALLKRSGSVILRVPRLPLLSATLLWSGED